MGSTASSLISSMLAHHVDQEQRGGKWIVRSLSREWVGVGGQPSPFLIGGGGVECL